MHPDIGIVRINRRPCDIYMRPDYSNTLTYKFSDKNDASGDLLIGPIARVFNRLQKIYIQYGNGRNILV